MITLHKLGRDLDNDWWKVVGTVDLDVDSIESLQEFRDWSKSVPDMLVGTLIRTKSGDEHIVNENQELVGKMMGLRPKPKDPPEDRSGQGFS